MNTKSTLRVGLIGFGVGKLYAAALQAVHDYYPDLPRIELAGIATASPRSGRQAVEHFGFQRSTTDFRSLVDDPSMDALVIATPPNLHAPMAIAALEAGKPLYLDKPLAQDLRSAQAIVSTAQRVNADAQMIFEFRHCPALQLAHAFIQQDRLGEVYAFRGAYLRGRYLDPQRTLRWKGEAEVSGAGVLNDTAPHVIDLVLWLLGDIVRVAAKRRTFVKERPSGKQADRQDKVTTEDHAIVQAELAGGGIGTIEAGRMVMGAVHGLSLEVNGSRASLRWNLMEPNYLEVAERIAGDEEPAWRKVPTVQSYPDAAIPGWDLPVGMMRFHIASMADFIRRSLAGEGYDPGLRQGLRVQAVVDAALRADDARRWVNVGAGDAG